MKNGWKMSGDEKAIKITKNGRDIMFNIDECTMTGIVYCLYLKHITIELALSASVTNRRAWSMIEAHALLGH